MKKRHIVTFIGMSTLAATPLIHKEKVKVVNEKMLSCDKLKAIKLGNGISANVTVEKLWSSSGDYNSNGGSVNYKINISFSSGSGNVEPITGLKIELNPQLIYSNYSEMTAAEKAQAENDAALLSSKIQYEVGSLGQLNSKSSVSTIASITVPSCDYDMVLNPNIKVVYNQPNGTVTTDTVSNNGLTQNYTRTYNDTIGASVSSWTGKLLFGINSSLGVCNGLFYSPGNYEMKTVTFKLTNSNSSATFTPIKSFLGQYFKSDGNDLYTISGPYIEKYLANLQDLFTLSSTKTFVDTVTLTPVSVGYSNYPDGMLSKTTNIQYWSSNANLVVADNSSSTGASSTDSSNGNGISGSNITANQLVGTNNHSYKPDVTYISNVTQPNNSFNVYTGVAFENGQAIIKSNGVNQLQENQVGVSLTSSELQTMLFGTAEAKAQMFQGIIAGTVGSKYDYNYVESGKPINGEINFVYTNAENGVNSTLNVIGSSNGTILEKVSTLAYSKENLSSVPGLQSYDTVLKNNRNIVGFFMGSNPSEGEAYAMTNQPGYSGGCGQSTSIRFGDQTQHNTSSATCGPWDWTNSYIDNMTKNLPNADVQWLTSAHTITVANTQMMYDNIDYEKNLQLVINSSVPMRLGNSVTLDINGKQSTYSNMKLSNDGKTLTLDIQGGFNANSKASVSGIYFTTFGGTPIYVNGNFLGLNSDNPSGKVIEINGQQINYSSLFGGDSACNSSEVNLALTSDNNCVHYNSTVNKNNSTVITNMIHNSTLNTENYIMAGLIPTNLPYTLTGSNGEPSYGGLNSDLLSINGNGAEVWLLPISEYSTYAKAMADPNADNLGKELNTSGSPGPGWVLYTPGMNLSDYVGYVARVSIAPEQNWQMSYGIQLTGVSSYGLFQYVTSQFKYYNVNNNTGSDSNIVTLSPCGIEVKPQWISTVEFKDSEGDIAPLTTSQLSDVVDGNELSYLNSKGLDSDGQTDQIPDTSTDHLKQEFNMVLNKEAMADAGYKLDGIYIKGNYYDATTTAGLEAINNWLNSSNISEDDGIDAFKFIISGLPKGKITTSIEMPNGDIVPGSEGSSEGWEGVTANLGSLNIPNGYKVGSITVNGNPVNSVNGIEYSNGTENIVYHLVPEVGVVNTETEYPDGTIVVGSVSTSSGDVNSKATVGSVLIPNGYELENETLNGNVISADTPIEYENNEQTVIYHLKKRPVNNIDEEMETLTGEVIIANKVVASGYSGENVSYNGLEIPKGYTLDYITLNGQRVNSLELPKVIGSADDNIVYIVKKITEENTGGTTTIPAPKPVVNIEGTGSTATPESTKPAGSTGGTTNSGGRNQK